ncbi:MAG: TnsA-like heteromeric transposase endonuclease subunit [Mycobacterium sp.]|nr:TnsA-like heteromeric transposase endonuclease subunit [Mycobacterium sp.]
MGYRERQPPPVTVSYRRSDDLSEVTREWPAAGIDELAGAVPWRSFRWYRGQKHYSGTYWSSTVGGHVTYESRLELSRLLLADFDAEVRHIVAQPFLLRARVNGKLRRHVPDYLLIEDSGPVVVDVKPARRLADPKVAFTFGWTRQVVEERGWRFEVATESPAVELGNVRFLAGYRRSSLFSLALLERVRAEVVDGASLGHAFECLPGESPSYVKSAVLHLLWRRELRADLTEPLSGRTLLRRLP